eukprot:54333-Eustigmatos_ZCMA.PRE.2
MITSRVSAHRCLLHRMFVGECGASAHLHHVQTLVVVCRQGLIRTQHVDGGHAQHHVQRWSVRVHTRRDHGLGSVSRHDNHGLLKVARGREDLDVRGPLVGLRVVVPKLIPLQHTAITQRRACHQVCECHGHLTPSVRQRPMDT